MSTRSVHHEWGEGDPPPSWGEALLAEFAGRYACSARDFRDEQLARAAELVSHPTLRQHSSLQRRGRRRSPGGFRRSLDDRSKVIDAVRVRRERRRSGHRVMRGASGSRYGWIGALLSLVLVAQAWAAEGPHHRGPPPSDGPLQVQIGFQLLNLTDVNEKEETIDIEGYIVLRWSDPRLAYDPAEEGLEGFVAGDYARAPARIYQGDFAVKEVFERWRPHVEVMNGHGSRDRYNMAVGVWPDGHVAYADYFAATVETPMDLRRFPFDRQSLQIYLAVLHYQRDEIVLVPDEFMSGASAQDEGIAEWNKLGIEIEEVPHTQISMDGHPEVYSQLVVTIHLERRPGHTLFSIILPLLILVSLTWSVFWMDEESISSRVNVSFVGILSVVAYYFVVLDRAPEIPYLTLMDAFMIATFLALAGSVVINFVADHLNRTDREKLGNRVDRICRWAFPVGYSAGIGLLVVFFLTLA